MKPVAAFTVSARGVRVKVRVLPSVAAVDAAWLDGKPRFDHRVRHAFFVRPRGPLGSAGTIVLPADGDLTELVPHEVVHAVMHDLRAVCLSSDEELATAVGQLSAKIGAGLRRRGVTP